MTQTDVLIVGGGAGGLSAASGLSQLGLDVVLINNESNMGGDCLHYGCIPSKTLIHAAKCIHEARQTTQYGLKIDDSALSAEAIFSSVQDVIRNIQPHDSIERFEKLGVSVKIGQPTFKTPHTMDVNGETIKARYIILATGSRPGIPPIPGLNESNPLTNETVFNMKTLPKRLALIGGGAIGCELAQAFQRLGCNVTLLEALPQILPFLDRAMAEKIQTRLAKESIQIKVSAKITQVKKSPNGFDLQYAIDDETFDESFDSLIVAAGRVPNTETLGLDLIGIETDKLGIKVDHRLRTCQKHIFAIGDVASQPAKFTHTAEFHAGIVLQNIAFRFPKSVKNPLIPACVYTDPEVAIIGLSEKEAGERYTHTYTETLDYGSLDRAKTDANEFGVGQLVFGSGKLVGVTLIGAHAGDLISEWRYVLGRKLKISDVASNIHPYPNYAQFNKRITGKYYGPKIFSDKTRKLVRLLHGKWF